MPCLKDCLYDSYTHFIVIYLVIFYWMFSFNLELARRVACNWVSPCGRSPYTLTLWLWCWCGCQTYLYLSRKDISHYQYFRIRSHLDRTFELSALRYWIRRIEPPFFLMVAGGSTDECHTSRSDFNSLNRFACSDELCPLCTCIMSFMSVHQLMGNTYSSSVYSFWAWRWDVYLILHCRILRYSLMHDA